MKFTNQVAIVTASAGAGIGQATARALAQEGASIVVTDVHPKRTNTVAEDIAATHKVATLAVVCDVTDPIQVDNLIKLALEKFGKIDMLVNNAGFDIATPHVDLDMETLTRIVNITLMGTFYTTKAVLPTMIKQGKGGIVNLSSMAAYTPDVSDSAVYCASKAGVVAFTRKLAREVGKHNIRVNAIAPGVVMNPFLEKVMPREELDEMVDRFMSLGRAGVPEDIAKAIMFLLSEEAAFISGVTLPVAGGW